MTVQTRHSYGQYVVRHPALPYPLTFDQIVPWCRDFGFSRAVGLRRFLSYRVLQCVAANECLNNRLILRGGAALWLRFGGQRPFIDIDFLGEGLNPVPTSDSRTELLEQLNEAIHADIFEHFPKTEEWESFVQQSVKVEVAPALPPYPFRRIALGVEGVSTIRVVDLERALVDKICGLLQQERRERRRGKDVADIASMMLSHGDQLNYRVIDQIYTLFAARRDLVYPIMRSSFNASVRDPAMATFPTADSTDPHHAMTFDSAWTQMLLFVDRLKQANLSKSEGDIS